MNEDTWKPRECDCRMCKLGRASENLSNLKCMLEETSLYCNAEITDRDNKGEVNE